jgi:RimJ/RimL family protein N-acetyltransferase
MNSGNTTSRTGQTRASAGKSAATLPDGRRTLDNAGMDGHGPDVVVVGERAALGPLRRDLAATYARWLNQLDVRFGLGQRGIATTESQERWVEENLERGAQRRPEGVEFTIYDRADSVPVGTAGLFKIDHLHGTAEFGIALGERRGRGLGTEATRLALDFGSTCCNCATCSWTRWPGTTPG